MVEKQSGGGKTDEHETEVRLPFKNFPPYAVPPPAARSAVCWCLLGTWQALPP